MSFSNEIPLVAVDIGSHSVKIAQLKQTRAGYDLESFGLLPLQPDVIADGVIRNADLVVEALASLVKAEKVTTRFAAGSVAGDAAIIKKIKVPIMTWEELDENIHKEVEKHIPFGIGEVSMDFQILRPPEITDKASVFKYEHGKRDKDVGKMEILLAVVKQEVIDSRTEILTKAGLKPVLIDLDVFAMMHAVGLSQELDHSKTLILIDLGNSFTHIHLIDHGFSCFTHDFKIGGRKCTEKLQTTFEIPREGAEAIKSGRLPKQVDKEEAADIIAKSFDPILNEVANTASAFENQTGRKPEKILLSGGGSLISGVRELFQNDLKLPVEIFNPMQFIGYDRKKFDAQCIFEIAPIATVAIGLASRRLDYHGLSE